MNWHALIHKPELHQVHIQDDLNRLMVDCEVLNRKYEAVINSTIWRASKPLMILLDKLKGN